MKLVKRLLAGATAVAMAAGAAACSTSTTATGGDSAKGGDVTLSWLAWIPDEPARAIVDAFEKANPGIKIDLGQAQGAASDYAQLLTTRIAGGQIPDIFHMSIETRNEIMDGGYAMDLTGKPFMEGIDPMGSSLYTRDGKVYGMSVSAWAGVIVYNKDLLAQVGADTVPEKLDEFIELGKKLQEKGITPYMEDTSVVSGSFNPMLGGYLAAKGYTDDKDPVFKEGKTFSEVWTPVVAEWAKLPASGVLPKEAVGVKEDAQKEQFLQGKLAMWRSGPWDVPAFKEAGLNFGTAAFPAVAGGEPFIGGGPDSPYVLSSKLEGAKLEAAEKFMSFINSAEGLKILEEKGGQMSTSTKFNATVDPAFQDVYSNYLQKGKYFWITWPKDGNVMGEELVQQFQKLIMGQATPEEVTAGLDAKWKK